MDRLLIIRQIQGSPGDLFSRFPRRETLNTQVLYNTGFLISELLIHHQKWVEDAAKAFDGELTIDKDSAGDYESCQLGQWLGGAGKEIFGDREAFDSLV